jgi:large subunit ribosomal protein L24
MLNRIKKNSTVAVISGKDKGKQGSVIEFLPKENKIKVKDVAVVAHYRKARRQGETSAIVRAEAFISMSKVMPVCGSCKKPTVPRVKLVDNKKMLMCKRCEEII